MVQDGPLHITARSDIEEGFDKMASEETVDPFICFPLFCSEHRVCLRAPSPAHGWLKMAVCGRARRCSFPGRWVSTDRCKRECEHVVVVW